MPFWLEFRSFSGVLSLGILLLVLGVLTDTAAGQEACPGRYCGRLSNESAACGACPRGFRRDAQSVCRQCTTPLSPYQWLYLFFIVGLLFCYDIFCIHVVGEKESVIGLQVSSFLEKAVAAIFTVLSFQPQGNVTLETCGVEQLSDWYPIFYNPSPGFSGTVHCTSEVVYPMYSMVFVFLAYNLLLLMTARPLLVFKFHKSSNWHSLYDTLVFMPILAVIHATCAGLIYYVFPYATILGSLVSVAYFFSAEVTEGSFLSRKSFYSICFLHILAHTFGISSILVYFEVSGLWPLVLVSFVPTIVFLLAVRFSSPQLLKLQTK